MYNDVYSDPYRHDLFPLAELELEEPDYSFDILMVWRHAKTEKLYWAQDSGCSCPLPFEDYTSLESLEMLGKWDYPMIERIVKGSGNGNTVEAAYFLREVKAALEML